MSTDTFQADGVRVAVTGCGHGKLDVIYASVTEAAKVRGWDGVDIVIIGGDFQSVRNAEDLSIMSCPVKYRRLGDFPKYYSGEVKAPYPTIFIAGNHEASSHLWELYYGGWVAPNIYYLGAANVLRFGPLRIAGLSGIWKGHDYRKSHHERLPFGGDDVKSFYHVREFDVRKLLQVRTQVDVGMSHDWPRAIERDGDEDELFKAKPFFKRESLEGTLGSEAAKFVMDRLRPPFWFSAHMHVRFAAIKEYVDSEEVPNDPVPSDAGPSSANVEEGNPDEIDLDLDDDDTTDAKPEEKTNEAPAETTNEVSEELRAQLPASFTRPPPQSQSNRAPGQPVPPGIVNKTVRFLALDKYEPRRKFLQLMEMHPYDSKQQPAASQPEDGSRPRYHLQYDPEWLAITRAFHSSLELGNRSAQTPPDLGEEAYRPLIDAEREWVDANVVSKGKLDVPENFEITAPPYEPGTPEIVNKQPQEYTSPQTAAFCQLLEIENLWDLSKEERQYRRARGPPSSERSGFRGGQRGGGNRGGGRGGGRGRGRGGGRGRAH